MSEFVNRQASDINKKRLEVEKVEYGANGDISSMDVYISRIDTPTEVGTRLDKESLENAIKDFVYYKLFGMTFSADPKNVNVLQNATESINISYENIMLYPKVIEQGRFNISTSNYVDEKTVIVEFSCTNTASSTFSDVYVINLYSDSSLTKYVCQVRGVVTYNPSSTGSTD